jgi:hypothetical protein
VKGLNYSAFLGNGLNTLNISANKIDTHLAVSGSVWWKPLGPYIDHSAKIATCTMIISPPKKFAFELVPRLQGPERTVSIISNNQIPTTLHCTIPTACKPSRPGRLRRGVTLNLATYTMRAADWGIK